MKKILLLAAAALMVSGASAQLQRSQALHTKAMPKAEFVTKPEAQKLEMHKATATNKLQKQQAPRRLATLMVSTGVLLVVSLVSSSLKMAHTVVVTTLRS